MCLISRFLIQQVPLVQMQLTLASLKCMNFPKPPLIILKSANSAYFILICCKDNNTKDKCPFYFINYLQTLSLVNFSKMDRNLLKEKAKTAKKSNKKLVKRLEKINAGNATGCPSHTELRKMLIKSLLFNFQT